MAENSSRMTAAQEAQESKSSISRSPETNKTNMTNKEQTNSEGPGCEGSGFEPSSSLSASSLLDAAEYVEAVMCSQQITTVLRTPVAVNSSRKRHLSLPAVGESEVKKDTE